MFSKPFFLSAFCEQKQNAQILLTFIQKYVKIFVNIIFHRSDVEKIKVNDIVNL